jgi:cytochrome c-type biogenesis protein CcmH
MTRVVILLLSIFVMPLAHADSAVEGNIQLDPKLLKNAKPTDTVFVFARAVTGPRIPLAILRAKVSDLPLKYHLDDSNAMQPGMNLSHFDQVVVVARISASGEAMPQKGDMEGLSKPVSPGKGKADVTIDKVIP